MVIIFAGSEGANAGGYIQPPGRQWIWTVWRASCCRWRCEAHETSDVVLLEKRWAPIFVLAVCGAPDAGLPHPEAYSRRPESDLDLLLLPRDPRRARCPVVGVIEGRCMGFGTAVAACCDVSFAGCNAQFNIPEMTHEVMPTMVMSALYDRMNRNAIMWMTYSAEFIDAQRG